jgi:hypothetical protein
MIEVCICFFVFWLLVFSLDRNFDETAGVPKVIFPEGSSNVLTVHVLYRPGHYDILYM